jgi:hypothetical protein
MDKVSRTFVDIHGLKTLIGTSWRPSRLNPRSFQMYGHSNSHMRPLSHDSAQMKQANFDVSHELDEFLMVEKPLTHTKRKANADLDKLKPELRHLEEKYVCASAALRRDSQTQSCAASQCMTLPDRNGYLTTRTTNLLPLSALIRIQSMLPQATLTPALWCPLPR